MYSDHTTYEIIHFSEWLNIMNDSNAPQTCPDIFYLRTVCVIKFTHFETLVLVEKKTTFFLCSSHEHISANSSW